MSKYYGKLGFGVSCETYPGVWEMKITERFYYGDVLRQSRSNSFGSEINADLNMNVSLSIMSDDYARENLGRLLYAEYMGELWNINSIEPQIPRVVLALGGVYNGEQA